MPVSLIKWIAGIMVSLIMNIQPASSHKNLVQEVCTLDWNEDMPQIAVD
jgi:hypothetical protein